MNADADRLRLRHMLDAAEKIVAFTEGLSTSAFLANEEKQLAVVRLLEIAGEAASSLSDELREEHAEIPWSQITATRNRLIHGYFDVDLNVVWRIVREDVPILVTQLRAIL
jgi:uncharacterized protein with HEPN domain